MVHNAVEVAGSMVVDCSSSQDMCLEEGEVVLEAEVVVAALVEALG